MVGPIAALPDEAAVLDAIKDLKAIDLNRLAREMNIEWPHGRKLSVAERRAYVADRAIRDRGRWAWR